LKEILYTAYLTGSLKLSRFGEWWHNGVIFQNKRLSDFFHKSIVWDQKDAQYYLEIGNQRATFEIEGTAYFVAELLDQKLPWQVRLMDHSAQELDLESLKLGAQNEILCSLENKHLASFTKPAYQRLVSHIGEDGMLRAGKHLISLSPKDR